MTKARCRFCGVPSGKPHDSDCQWYLKCVGATEWAKLKSSRISHKEKLRRVRAAIMRAKNALRKPV